METISGEVDIRYFPTAAFLPLFLFLFSLFSGLQKHLNEIFQRNVVRTGKWLGTKRVVEVSDFRITHMTSSPKRSFSRVKERLTGEREVGGGGGGGGERREREREREREAGKNRERGIFLPVLLLMRSHN